MNGTCLTGQYSGHSEPLPEYHVKIAGFDERVSLLNGFESSSIRNVYLCILAAVGNELHT